MRRIAGVAAAGILTLMLVHGPVAIASSPPPCPTPSPTAASSSRTCVNPAPDPYAELQKRLGGDLAKALRTQQNLVAAIDNASATELALSGELTLEEARVADLQNQVDELDQQISDLESRIDVEREQISILARAMYQRPTSILDIIANSGNLSDMLSQTAEMVVAGQRAHALQDRLQADLTQVQADRDARQSDLDQETAAMDQVQAGLQQLSGVQTELDSLSGQLAALLTQIRTAAANLKNVPVEVSAQLASLLEQQETSLDQAEQSAAWAQASVGTGLAVDENLLPGGTGNAGIGLSWPMAGGVITQPFGPTSFVLEPPLGPYPHFHTGIDIAAPLGTPVVAAAAGIVVAVAHTAVGYGNYVIIAHGSGVLTLYGHLLQTHVSVGQAVTAGQLIGNEGSTGYSTGPHLHFEVRINGQVTDPMRFLPPL